MEKRKNTRTEHSRSIPALRFPEFLDKCELVKLNKIITRFSNPVKVIPNEYYQEIGISSHGKGIFHKPIIQGEELGNKRVFWVNENALVLNIVFAWEQAIANTTLKEKGLN